MRIRLDRQTWGTTGLISVVVLVVCLFFYITTLAPKRDELVRALDEERKVGPVPPMTADVKSPRANLDDVRGKLPPVIEATELFDKLYTTATSAGLTVERATYSLTRLGQAGILQYEVSLPVRGAYPSIRKFVHEALDIAPVTSLDSISFQRSKVTDPLVDTTVHLSYYFKAK